MKFYQFPILLLLTFYTCGILAKNAFPAVDGPEPPGIKLNIRVYLQGALIGAKSQHALMRDDLRRQGFLPVVEPYTELSNFAHIGIDGGDEFINVASLFQVSGQHAIVDWVFIELRDPYNPATVVATRSALLQRNGAVVDTDGSSPLHFASIEPGDFYVAVRHRNHLGVMSALPFSLSGTPQLINFSEPDFPTYGEHAQRKVGSIMAMFGGDVNRDGKCISQGPGNDLFNIFGIVLTDGPDGESPPNHIVYGYTSGDINLDGKTVYMGPENDRMVLLFEIHYPWISECNGAGIDCALVEKLP